MNRAFRLLPALLVALAIYLLSDRALSLHIPSGLSETLSVLMHVLEYAALAFALRYGLEGAVSPRVIVLLALLYGVSDEFHQSFVPGRNATALDLIPDFLGAVVGVVLFAALRARKAQA